MALPELFRVGAPPEGWQREVAQQGFVLLPGALTEAAAEALTSEVLATEEAAPVVAGTAQSGSARGAHAICGPVADALLDAPLLRSMLGATFEGGRYEVCHTTFSVRAPGSPGGGLHQDFFFGPAPWCERDCPHQSISVFVYPTGFSPGDCALTLIPGSPLVDPFDEALQGPQLQNTVDNARLPTIFAERFGLQPRELTAPPGTLVLLNCKVWHAVGDKPAKSPQPYRIFRNYIFKTVGSEPHQHTQSIPPSWLRGASAHRRMLFARQPGPDFKPAL